LWKNPALPSVWRPAAYRSVRNANPLKKDQMYEILARKPSVSKSWMEALGLIFHSFFHNAVYLATTYCASFRFKDSDTSASASENRGP